MQRRIFLKNGAFALVTMGGGAVMGLCFAFMWVTSIWQMWFAKVPAAVLNRTESGPRAVG